MKTLIRIVVALIIVFLAVVVGGIAYVNVRFPQVAKASEISVEITAERIDRGRYLANHVCACMDCHTKRDFSMYAAPPKWDELGSGGEVFDEKMNFPGYFTSKNLTPHGLDDWTDGEILRAITTGVNKDGKVLFPVMPWPKYAQMAEEDLFSIIAYLRSLDPIVKENTESRASFPMNIVMKTMPKDVEIRKDRPDPQDKIAYGEYLVNAAACGECHTKQVKGKVVGKDFAGGFEFKFPQGTLRSANITPDSETGIGEWSEEMFLDKFRSYRPDVFDTYPVESEADQTIMPWLMYASMTDEDLSAIYAFLRTVEAVHQEEEGYIADSMN
jgi:mono/diheme cytochrome c family protein